MMLPPRAVLGGAVVILWHEDRKQLPPRVMHAVGPLRPAAAGLDEATFVASLRAPH